MIKAIPVETCKPLNFIYVPDTIYVGNAISGQMLPDDCTIVKRQLDPRTLSAFLLTEDWTSCVGHASTAAVFSDTLGIEVPHNRVNVNLTPGDALIVGQYTGPRLEEGATTLPEGAVIKWAVYYLPLN